MNYQKPKGTRDIYGVEAKRIEKINALARSFFGYNGFDEIKTPSFEFVELFTRSIGEATDIVEKEMYAFTIDDRVYVLRPEGTASALRAVIENKINLPARLLYIGQMFRKEKPQKGRYREFLQIGIENLGKADPFYDAEIILLAKEFLNLIGVKDFYLQINSIGCPDCRNIYRSRLSEYLEPQVAGVCADCQRRFERNFLRIFDCKKESCQGLYDRAPMITDHLCAACAAHYAKVKLFLKDFNIAHEENKKLVRGLDYYTRTVFEFKHRSLGAQDTMIAGGRYDRLMKELGGDDLPCIGWAMGVERMLLIMDEDRPAMEKPKSIFIVTMGEQYLKEMIGLREIIIRHEMICHLGNPDSSVKNQMKDANRFKVDLAILYGDDEAKEGYYTVKNMQSGEQIQILKDDLDKFLTEAV